MLLLKTGRPEEALQILKPLIAEVRDDADYQNVYALALWDSGRRVDARQFMARLLKEFPTSAAVQGNAKQMGL